MARVSIRGLSLFLAGFFLCGPASSALAEERAAVAPAPAGWINDLTPLTPRDALRWLVHPQNVENSHIPPFMETSDPIFSVALCICRCA